MITKLLRDIDQLEIFLYTDDFETDKNLSHKEKFLFYGPYCRIEFLSLNCDVISFVFEDFLENALGPKH